MAWLLKIMLGGGGGGRFVYTTSNILYLSADGEGDASNRCDRINRHVGMNGTKSVGRYSSGTKMEGLGESQASAIVLVGATMEKSVRVGWLGVVLERIFVMEGGVGYGFMAGWYSRAND